MWCSKSIKPTNHLSILFTTSFLHNRISCAAWNILSAWAINYFPPHHMLFYLLYCNITSSSPYVYYLLSVKIEFVFTLRNGGPVKIWPTGPSATALTWSNHIMCVINCRVFVQHTSQALCMLSGKLLTFLQFMTYQSMSPFILSRYVYEICANFCLHLSH